MRHQKVMTPKLQYVVVVQRGATKKYRWSGRLKDAMEIVKPGEKFVWAKYERGPEMSGELAPDRHLRHLSRRP